jgi:hypothetical protein
MIDNLWRDLIRAIKSSLVKDSWKRVTKSDVFIMRHDIHCGYVYKGKAYAHLFDSLAENLMSAGLKCQTIAFPCSTLVGEKAHNSPISINRCFLKIALLKFLYLPFLGKKKARAFEVRKRKESFIHLIKLSEVKTIITVETPQYLIEACKECDVLLYKMQHGLMSKNHGMVQHLKSLVSENSEIPSGVLCWDYYSSNFFKKLGVEKLEIWVVGNPWFLRYFFPKKNDLLVRDSIREVRKIGFLSNQHPNILVSLQYGLKKYFNAEHNVMIEPLRKIILETKGKYNWLLRMHPLAQQGVEKEEQLKFLNSNFGGKENIEWEVATQLSLPALLKNIDLHITYNSSTVVEAAWLGIPSAVLFPIASDDNTWNDLFAKERDAGLVTVVPQTEEALLQWIETTLLEKKETTKFEDELKKQNEGLTQFAVHIKNICGK